MDRNDISEVGEDGKALFWFVMRVSGQGMQWVLAESADAALAIVALAFPRSTVLGKWGYAKVRPAKGTPVIRQVPAPVVRPDDPLSPKDDRELQRRGGLNYERSGY